MFWKIYVHSVSYFAEESLREIDHYMSNLNGGVFGVHELLSEKDKMKQGGLNAYEPSVPKFSLLRAMDGVGLDF